jgi:hypothetical protein
MIRTSLPSFMKFRPLRTCIRRDVLERCRFRSRCCDNDGILHGIIVFKRFDQLSHGRLLLAYGHIDTDDIFFLLVDDRVDSDSRFTGLTVSDDQLPLAAADWNHGVNRFYAGLKRLMD